MDKKVFSIGVTILLIGTFLIFAFWPLTAISAQDLAEEKENDYDEYDIGEKVRVYGTITDVNEVGLLDIVVMELDGDMSIVIENQDEIEFDEGDVVYCEIKRSEVIEDFGYWELEDDISSKRIIDYVFYGVVGAGIAVAAVGAIKE